MAGPVVSDEKIAEIFAKVPIEEAKNAKLHHLGVRVKNPEASLDFYRTIFGMRLQWKADSPDHKMTVYFVGYGTADAKADVSQLFEWNYPSIELIHIWGSESQPDLKFASGNTKPTGFSHMHIQVPDVYAFAKRAESLGFKFVKKPDEGNPKGMSVIQDPDGYHIEVMSEFVPAPGEKNPEMYNDMFKF